MYGLHDFIFHTYDSENPTCLHNSTFEINSTELHWVIL